MTRFIRKKVAVANPDFSMIYCSEAAKDQHAFAPESTNIFLVGLRASGKSTLGELLAQRLDMVFVDTDELVVRRAGMPIAQIVATEGWEAFRDLEKQALQGICGQKGQVVATGGGIVLLPENRELLQKCGTTFYLMAEPRTLLKRLANAPNTEQRPPLTDLGLHEELFQCNAQRGPLYMCVASHILHAEQPLDDVLQEALEKLGMQ